MISYDWSGCPSDNTRSVTTAKWVGDCFIYTTAGNRVNYFVGNESYTISPSDVYVPFGHIIFLAELVFFSPMYILGYIPAHNRVYLADKDMNIYGYALSLSVVEYQTAVLRSDMEAAAEILPTLPKEQLNKVARFLEGRGRSFTLDPEASTCSHDMISKTSRNSRCK